MGQTKRASPKNSELFTNLLASRATIREVTMKLPVHQIPVHGRTYQIGLDDNWVRQEIETVLEGKLISFSGELTILNHNSRVQVTGSIEVTLQLQCDICATDIKVNLDGDLNLFYLPDHSPTVGLIPKTKKDLEKINEMISLNEEDLDAGWYFDGILDVGVVLSEYLLIKKSTIVQCKDDNVTRINAGECREFPTKGSKNTYNPFAGLDLS